MEIRIATADDIPAIRSLWQEYWAFLGLPLDLQGFQEELLALPGPYLLLVAIDKGRALGTAAWRDLGGGACEMKRVYVRPEAQGLGIGRSLVTRLIEEAGAYDRIYADTLPSMTAALELYRSIGFEEVGPYAADPTLGAIYLRLKLPPATAPTTK